MRGDLEKLQSHWNFFLFFYFIHLNTVSQYDKAWFSAGPVQKGMIPFSKTHSSLRSSSKHTDPRRETGFNSAHKDSEDVRKNRLR